MPPSEMRISGLSSDVCSSDLAAVAMHAALADARIEAPLVPVYANVAAAPVSDPDAIRAHLVEQVTGRVRSEERRVGQEWVRPCRSRWSAYHKKKKCEYNRNA